MFESASQRVVDGTVDAFSLFSDSNQCLAGDRAARMDWEHLLRVAVAYFLWKQGNEKGPALREDRLGEWVEENSRYWATTDAPLPGRTVDRLGEAMRAWQKHRAARLSWEALDRGLTAAIEERMIKVDALLLSPATARLVVSFLAPEPSEWVLCYGSPGGEVAGATVRGLQAKGAVSDPAVHVVDRRVSLHPLTHLRVLLATGQPEAIACVKTEEYLLSHADDSVPHIYASFLDHQDEADERRTDYQIEKVTQLHHQLKPGGRMVLAVPEVVLSGSTWSSVRQDWVRSGHLRLIAQLPAAAVTNGTIKAGLVFLEKARPWPPVPGAIMADLGARGRDLDPQHVGEVLGALRGRAPKESVVWFHEQLDPARLDPAFHRNRREVQHKLSKLQYRLKQLRTLGVQVLRNGSTSGYAGKLSDQTVTVRAINGLQIDPDLCRQGLMANSHPLLTGSVLLTTGGTPGKAAVVTPDFDGWRLGPGMVELLIPPGELDPYYLAVLFESDLGQAMLSLITKGSQTEFIPMHEIADMLIPVPAPEVQQRIAAEALTAYTEAARLRQRAAAHERKARLILEPKR